MSSICFPWFNTLSQWKCSSWRRKKSAAEEHRRVARHWLCCRWWGHACVNLLYESTETVCAATCQSRPNGKAAAGRPVKKAQKPDHCCSSLRRWQIWTFWEPGPREVTYLIFSTLLCVSKPWLWGQRCQKGCQDHPPLSHLPQLLKENAMAFQGEMSDRNSSSSSLGLPWGLLKVGHVSLIFIVYIYYLYTIAASRRVNGCFGVC